MSKTTAAVVCETNQIAKHNQENIFFHGLYRVPSEFSSSYFRSAKSTTPIQIFACFSAQGDDTLAAMTLQKVLKKMQELSETTQLMSVMDYESFTNQVVHVLNQTVCQSSLDNNGASIRVAMSMVIIEGDTLRVMNIGNTHIWLYRGGKLISLTENQTVAHRYVQMGAIDKSEESTHEGKNELTQYLGRFPQDGEIIPDKKVHLKLLDGDDICILGTGLDQGVSIQKLGMVIARPTQPETKTKEMIDCAMSNGVKYGLTAMVIHVDSTLILPGEANLDTSNMSNWIVAAPAVAVPPVQQANVQQTPVAQPSVSNVSAPASDVAAVDSDAPTIQTDALRYQMNQQPPLSFDTDEVEDEDQENENDEDKLDAPMKKAKKSDKRTKKSSAWKTFLIGLLIFTICIGVGYGGMYVLFNAGHWTGKLKSTTYETSETDSIEGKVMYVLFDDTVLYVEESLDSQAIDTLSRGEAVTLLATNETFAKVRKENGLMGYVPIEMIADVDPTAGEAGPSDFVDVTPVPTERITEQTSAPKDTTPTEAPTTTSETTVEITTESTTETTPETSETTTSETTTETTSESTTESTTEETTTTSETPEETTSSQAPDEGTQPTPTPEADPNEGNGEGGEP